MAANPKMQEFGDTIRNRRKRMNLTQKDVSALIGVSNLTYSLYELGWCNPCRWRVGLIEKALMLGPNTLPRISKFENPRFPARQGKPSCG